MRVTKIIEKTPLINEDGSGLYGFKYKSERPTSTGELFVRQLMKRWVLEKE
jgi:hypothetical protein